MEQAKFIKGAVYYQIGKVPCPPGAIAIWTWVFDGYVQREGGSSASCDEPGHFYRFLEFEAWSNGCTDGHTVLYIPNLTQACLSMRTWDELLAAIDELKNQE
jgi:hypothetical protein